MRKRSLRIGALLAVITAIGAAPSEANIIFERIGGGTGNNVLFQCPASGGDPTCAAELGDNDNILIGTVQNSTFQVRFTADVNIMPGAAGQATIMEVNAATEWDALTFNFIGFESTDLVILRIKPTTDDTTIILTACDDKGNCSFTSAPNFTNVDAPAGDFFRVVAQDDQLITRVGIAALNGSLSEVEQVRLGNLFVDDDIVLAPEPASLALFGMGLLVAGYRARRKMGQGERR